MIDDVASDLQDQIVSDELSFADFPSYPVKKTKPQPKIRSEEDVSIGSLALGTLVSGAILAACFFAWFVVLIAPIWGLSTLLF